MDVQDQVSKACLCSLLVAVSASFFCGCQSTAQINVKPVSRISDPKPKTLCLLAEATDARSNKSDQVGRHTFTIFMIPTFGVFSDEPVEKKVGKIFSDTLTQSGYDVKLVEKVDEADGPVLAVQVDSIRNYLFSWVWPLGLTGGRAKLTPVVFDNSGKVLWKGEPCVAWGGCPSVAYMAGFETSINMEMNSLMGQLVAQLNKPDFVATISRVAVD